MDLEQLLKEFETLGEGRVRFMWNREEAREFIEKVYDEAFSEGYAECGYDHDN